MSISKIYDTHAFRLLSQGMKDREAIAIVHTLMQKSLPFENFERWARDELTEQVRKDVAATGDRPADTKPVTQAPSYVLFNKVPEQARELHEYVALAGSSDTPPVITLIRKLNAAASYGRVTADEQALMLEASRALASLFNMKAPVVTGRKFALRDRVRKTKGSSWQGRVVGFYSTMLTPIGYAVESEREPGSVQIYPEDALELVKA